MVTAGTLDKPLSALNMLLLFAVLVLIGLRMPAITPESPDTVTTLPLALPIPNDVISRRNSVRALTQMLTDGYGLSAAKASRFAGWIHAASSDHQVPAAVLSALVMTESSFRVSARSSVGAIGPAQVRPKYWADECSVDLHEPASNIWCGAYVLRKYHDALGSSWEQSIKAYNIGISSLIGNINQAAGVRYLNKVQNHMSMLQLASVNLAP